MEPLLRVGSPRAKIENSLGVQQEGTGEFKLTPHVSGGLSGYLEDAVATRVLA